jgi:hypothetical protein
MSDTSGFPLEPGPAEEPLASTAGEKPGDRMDHYMLVEEIGAGGMGTVWLARQARPVQRDVALKVILSRASCGSPSCGEVGRPLPYWAQRRALRFRVECHSCATLLVLSMGG